MTRPAVSDHALLRYLERVAGIDVEGIRDLIAATTTPGAACGAPSIRISKTRFIQKNGSIVTVLSKEMGVHFDFLAQIVRSEKPTEPGGE